MATFRSCKSTKQISSTIISNHLSESLTNLNRPPHPRVPLTIPATEFNRSLTCVNRTAQSIIKTKREHQTSLTNHRVVIYPTLFAPIAEQLAPG
jgi:hypothetical protein